MIAILRQLPDYYQVAIIQTEEQLNLAKKRNKIIIAFEEYIARNNIISMYDKTVTFDLYKEKIFYIEKQIKNNCEILSMKESKNLLQKGYVIRKDGFSIHLNKYDKNYYSKEMKNWFTGKTTLHQIQNGIFAPNYLIDYGNRL